MTSLSRSAIMSIEAMPLVEVTDEQAEILLAWQDQIEREIRSSAAVAIALDIARNTLVAGSSQTSHKEYGRRCGVCRRSIDNSVKSLRRANIIERVGTTLDGRSIYRANLGAPGRANGVA